MKEEFNFRDIKSFEDACNHLGISTEIPITSLDFIEHYKLKIIIKVINNGWLVDFNTENQSKWYTYFTIDNYSVSMEYANRTYRRYRCLPLSLYLETKEKAEYMGRTFTDLYNEL